MSRLLWIVLAVMALGLVLLLASGDSGQVLGIDDDVFGRTLYVGVLAVVIGAGILGSGIRVGQAVRGMALWLLAILVLIAGYQYRYELQDVASRLTVGLIPGSPMSMLDDDGRAAVMIDRLANGHFEVLTAFNGTEISTLVDTGASSTVLAAADAARVGFDPAELAFNVPIMTANGQGMAARLTIDEISVGNIVRRRVPVLVAEPGRLDQSLLGMNFIGTLSGFDMRGERLILRD
jgi:aspartyl protease family protein